MGYYPVKRRDKNRYKVYYNDGRIVTYPNVDIAKAEAIDSAQFGVTGVTITAPSGRHVYTGAPNAVPIPPRIITLIMHLDKIMKKGDRVTIKTAGNGVNMKWLVNLGCLTTDRGRYVWDGPPPAARMDPEYGELIDRLRRTLRPGDRLARVEFADNTSTLLPMLVKLRWVAIEDGWYIWINDENRPYPVSHAAAVLPPTDLTSHLKPVEPAELPPAPGKPRPCFL